MAAVEDTSLRTDARAVAWWVLVGAGAGAIAGFLVGGIGGRLAMLLLRLTSPESVLGVTSDDGFEIGVVTTATFNLIFAMTMLGALNGILYAALRGAIPNRLRLPLWGLFAAAVGGATLVNDEGVDFQILESVALAIALFVGLPGLAAVLVVVLVERWIERDPATDRVLVAVLVVAAIASTFALVVAAVVGAIALAIRRAGGAGAAVQRVAGIVVPVTLVVLMLWASWNLATKASRII